MKRVMDFVLSSIGLILLSPLFLFLMIFISIESSGGPFYLQERVGRNGKTFKLIKFRSMKAGSDKKGLLTIGSNDARITRTGYFLRKYKVDELPQLINVFLGEMSLVGPRPEVKKYTDLYDEEQRKVLTIKPGITDYASLEYFEESDLLKQSNNPELTYIQEIMPAKLKINLKYVSENSIMGDFNIIWKTIKRILKK